MQVLLDSQIFRESHQCLKIRGGELVLRLSLTFIAIYIFHSRFAFIT